MKKILLLGLLNCSYVTYAQSKAFHVDIYNTFAKMQISNPTWNNKIGKDLSNLRIGLGYEKSIFNDSESNFLKKLSLVADIRVRNIGSVLSHSFDTLIPSVVDYRGTHASYNHSNLATLELGLGIKYHEKLVNRLFVAPYILVRPQYFFANATLNELYKSGVTDFKGDQYSYSISKVNNINRLGLATTLGFELLIYNKKRSSYGLNVAYTHGFVSLLDYDYTYKSYNVDYDIGHISETNVKTKGSGWDIGFRYCYTLK